MTPAELRDLFNDESLIPRMTSSAPPLVSQVSEHTAADGRVYFEITYSEEPADRTGQNLSGPMVALIGGVTTHHPPDNCEDCRRNPLLNEQRTSYGPRWPVRRALEEWERSCRRRHRPTSTQWRDHDKGPLCSDLLRCASVGVSLLWCCNAFGIEYPRAERLLNSGLRFVGERLARWQDDALGIAHDRDRCEVCRAEAQD